jgi:DNA-binding response OmpR family regulator
MATRAVVLLIEDHDSTRELLSECLESEGYAVESAAAGRPGLQRLEAGGVDLVLLDRSLPDMDGLELCRRVRSRAGGRHLPIITLTAAGGQGQREASLAAGADDYVAKPFDVDTLLDLVSLHLDGRDARRP